MKLAESPDFSRCRLVRLGDGTMSPVKEHVKLGVRALLANPYFGLLDEMGAMKSAQTIIAAQFLYEQGVINKVIVIAPHSVVPVWYDDELGELARHLFIPSKIQLYRGGKPKIWWYPTAPKDETSHLHWIISNYEFIRATNRLDGLLEVCDNKTLLVLDESSAIKGYKTQQTKACLALRKQCGRAVILNGTPIANNPLDMFSQGNFLSPSILECKGITYFRARYAEMGGYVVQTAWGAHPTQVIGWKNLDDLQRRFAPFVLRRLKRDCLDLPEVLPSVTLTAELTKDTWKLYKEMRDEMVAWLSSCTVSVALQTITKVMRLSQITSGFIGGLEPELYADLQEGRPDFLDLGEERLDPTETTKAIGREKLDVWLDWAETRMEADENLKLLTFCRFVPELKRLMEESQEKFPHVQHGVIAGKTLLGKTRKEERAEALRLLNPQTAPVGPAFVGGTYGTGSLGLNLTACHTMVNMSYDYSYWKFVQSAARVDRPGQVHPVSTFDIIAVGPQGQKTIDHAIVRARRDKEDVAVWTTSAWIHALKEE